MIFKYHAKDAAGTDKSGQIEALNENDATDKLHSQGLVIISVEREAESLAKSGIKVAIPTAAARFGSRVNANRYFAIAACIFAFSALFFISFCGIFVIQPIGAIPNGVTIVYWRSGLNLPFIASADGLLDRTGVGVSLLGRGLMLGGLADIIKSRELFRLPYSEILYLWSTG